MFWKKLAFRLDETPTSELGFPGHELGRQKNTSKTQGFSMIFLADRNSCHHLGPPAALQNPKTQIFLSKTLGFGAKVKKTQCFFHTFCERRISHFSQNQKKRVFSQQKRCFWGRPVSILKPLQNAF